MKVLFAVLLAVAWSLAAAGPTPGERTAYGAAILSNRRGISGHNVPASQGK